jgi:hypothetical protein
MAATKDPPPNAEGFICPVCHFMGKDGIELADHFEREHEEPSSGHKARLQALSHQNLAVNTFKPPPFCHQPNCRICHVAFGYSRTRHHCRNCGNFFFAFCLFWLHVHRPLTHFFLKLCLCFALISSMVNTNKK